MSWRGLVILALLFLTAFGYLFSLRFENGDFLPAYSSLRRDPMGTAVLFESLAQSGLFVQRNHVDFAITPLKPDTTLFILGVTSGSSGLFGSKSTRQKITKFMEAGGRLIIAYSPLFLPKKTEEEGTDVDTSTEDTQECSDQKGQEKTTDDTVSSDTTGDNDREEAEDTEEREPPPVWSVSLEQLPASDDTDPLPLATGAVAGQNLAMVWPHSMVFSDQDSHWQTLLHIENQAVLMEKRVGAGSIVLSTSSHYLSNEAMLCRRQLPLLTWLVGRSHTIVFDEFHHGLRSSKSITSLLRDYNLHGVIFLLFLLAILFLWRNSSSLLPRISSPSGKLRTLTGRDQFEGMVGLLRRHPPQNLLFTAFEQWRGENRDWCRTHQPQLTNIEQLAGQEDTLNEVEEVARYQTISHLIHPENQPHTVHHE